MRAHKGTFLVLQRYVYICVCHAVGRKRMGIHTSRSWRINKWTIHKGVGRVRKSSQWRWSTLGTAMGPNRALDVKGQVSWENCLERGISQELLGCSQHLPPAEDLTPWQWGRKGDPSVSPDGASRWSNPIRSRKASKLFPVHPTDELQGTQSQVERNGEWIWRCE